MATTIDHYKNIGFETTRVGLRNEAVVNARTSWLGRTIGIVTRSRQRENRRVYDDFKRSLEAEYGQSGTLALNQLSRVRGRALSAGMIRQVINAASQNGNASSKVEGTEPVVVWHLEGWQSLRPVDLKPGDIVIKKVFDQEKKGVVEGAITGTQSLFEKPEKVKAGGEVFEFPFLGHHSSGHAAVVLTNGLIAEAQGSGIEQNNLKDKADEKYIVFRPKSEQAAAEISKVADQFSRPNAKGGKYSLWGAVKSSFRDVINKPGKREQVLGSGLRYLGGSKTKRPNMFCSEFAAMCIEIAGSKVRHPENSNVFSTLGVSPRAVSPMVLEDLLNQRPDLFQMVGRYHGNSMPPGAQNDGADAVNRATVSASSVGNQGDENLAGDKRMVSIDEIGSWVSSYKNEHAPDSQEAKNAARVESGLNAYRVLGARQSSSTIADRANELWKSPGIKQIVEQQYQSRTPEEWANALAQLPPAQAEFELDILRAVQDDAPLALDLSSNGKTLLESMRAEWGKGSAEARKWFDSAAYARAVAASQESEPNGGTSVRSSAPEPNAQTGEGLLHSLDVRTVAVPGDGHCLFNSLSYALGGDARAEFEKSPLDAATRRRGALLAQALSLTDAQIDNLASQGRASGLPPRSNDELEQARKAWLTAAVLETSRGIDIATPSQEAWGTHYSLSLAAIESGRPVVAIGVDAKIDQYMPDGTKLNTIPGDGVELVRIIEGYDKQNVRPLVVYQQSAAHWQSVDDGLEQ